MPLAAILWAGTPTRLSPSKVIVPFLGRRRPATVFRDVDLPAPLAPIKVTISPSSTWKEMSLTAWIAP